MSEMETGVKKFMEPQNPTKISTMYSEINNQRHDPWPTQLILRNLTKYIHYLYDKT